MPFTAGELELVAGGGCILRVHVDRSGGSGLIAIFNRVQPMNSRGDRSALAGRLEINRQGLVGFKGSERLLEAASRTIRSADRREEPLESQRFTRHGEAGSRYVAA